MIPFRDIGATRLMFSGGPRLVIVRLIRLVVLEGEMRLEVLAIIVSLYRTLPLHWLLDMR